jgi:hypothetical protein
VAVTIPSLGNAVKIKLEIILEWIRDLGPLDDRKRQDRKRCDYLLK